MQPKCWALVVRNSDESPGAESPCGFKEQMEPGPPLVERPDLQLVSKSFEVPSCEKIFEFRRGRWHATGDFVAADSGEQDAVSLRCNAGCELLGSFVWAAA